MTNIDRTELQRLFDTGTAQVVDVLPEREYSESHSQGAINIPLRQLTVETVSMLRRDKPVVVY